MAKDKETYRIVAYLDSAFEPAVSAIFYDVDIRFLSNPKKAGTVIKAIAEYMHQKGSQLLGCRVVPNHVEQPHFKNVQTYPMIYFGQFKEKCFISCLNHLEKPTPWDYVINPSGKCIYGEDRLDTIFTLPSQELIAERMKELKKDISSVQWKQLTAKARRLKGSKRVKSDRDYTE